MKRKTLPLFFGQPSAELAELFRLVVRSGEMVRLPIRMTAGEDVTLARIGRGEGFAELLNHDSFPSARDMIRGSF